MQWGEGCNGVVRLQDVSIGCLPAPFPQTFTNNLAGAGLREPIVKWEAYKGSRQIKIPFCL